LRRVPDLLAGARDWGPGTEVWRSISKAYLVGIKCVKLKCLTKHFTRDLCPTFFLVWARVTFLGYTLIPATMAWGKGRCFVPSSLLLTITPLRPAYLPFKIMTILPGLRNLPMAMYGALTGCKPGKIVIVLKGRYAGRKAVIVKSNEDGTKQRPFPHAIVAGINVYPRKVTRAHSKKKVAQRSRVKCFVKHFNFTHLMPTRYALDIDLQSSVPGPQALAPSKKSATRRKVRAHLEKRYKTGKNRWFFTKLRF